MKGMVMAAVLLLLATGCSQDRAEIPADKMERILLDVQLAEVYSTVAGKDSTKKDVNVKNQDSLAVWYKSIFGHHGVTAEQFNGSMDWYRQHPEELDTIYNHVSVRLGDLQRTNSIQAPARP